MSLGVNLLSEMAQKAATVLGESFDIEIVERHHNQKKDAPSGTALSTARMMAAARGHWGQKGATHLSQRCHRLWVGETSLSMINPD